MEWVVPFGLWLLALNFAVGTLVTAWLNSNYAPLDLRPEFITILAGTVCVHGVALALIWWLVRVHRETFSSAFGFSASRLWWPVVVGISAAMLAMPVVLAVGYVWAKLLALFHFKVESQLAVQMLQDSASLEVRVLIGVTAILTAPVVEEMVFRGIFYPTLKRYGFRRTALWGTAGLFAMVHFNLMTFLPLVVLAVVLAWLYELTDNLLTPIVAHSFFNLVNYFLVSPLNLDGRAPTQ
jgi:membrane protease YdiL (CAAX protease family)